MTRPYLVQTKADDLKVGDMFVDWAAQLTYQEPRRILDIKTKHTWNHVELILDDKSTIKTDKNMLMIVEVLA